ncbi:MAG: nucleotide exchange factor GrpE [Holosporaceae bacterium]|jgi:molecular chaperone GrpE|nr:nucleotide exchange factor GrpE [Holosporaceae bacterium]
MSKESTNDNKKDENKDNCEHCHCNEEAEICDAANPDRIVELENEVRLLKDTLLRKIAEFDNSQKRFLKEKEDTIKYSNGKFAKDLLCVLDNFEKISESLPIIDEKIAEDQTLKAFFDGVVLCGKEMVSVFGRHGLSKINVAIGDVFDPNYHQAMCELESEEYNPGVILQIFQSGYIYNDRLLRPTMVSVSKKI